MLVAFEGDNGRATRSKNKCEHFPTFFLLPRSMVHGCLLSDEGIIYKTLRRAAAARRVRPLSAAAGGRERKKEKGVVRRVCARRPWR